MKLGVPWSVKGKRPQANQPAMEAADRAGITNSNPQFTGAAPQFDVPPPQVAQPAAGPAAYAPRRWRERNRIVQPTPPTSPRPRAPMPPALERALADIAARKRALNAAPAADLRPPAELAPPAAAPQAGAPTENTSGVEQQLRKITALLENLHKPGVEEAIDALRLELGDIRRAVNDAMPKQAIESLEKQIADLSQRIEEDRRAGVDDRALAGIEFGLTEVRDALHALMPAEHLVGYNDAIAGLAQKIDLIVAQKDPATLQQLEDAITTLRGMAGNVASNETVGRLAAEVESLAEKIEHIGRMSGGEAFSSLENRIDALNRTLGEQAQPGDMVSPRLEALVQSLAERIEQIGPMPVGEALYNLENRIDALIRTLGEQARSADMAPRLEAMLHALADKIEQIQPSRGDTFALSHLEDRIVGLVERLDASDSRLSHLEAIERGVADLLVHIEEMRTGKLAGWNAEAPAVDALKHDMARSQDTLDAVHDTLGLIVDRLVSIEQNIHGERRAASAENEPLELTQAVATIVGSPAGAPPAAARPMPAPSASIPAPKSQPAPVRLPPAAGPEIDEPLEPGSGPPPFQSHPAARIAASEAALGGARPATPASGGQTNFIAAARRAAKAALQEHEVKMLRASAPPPTQTGGSTSLPAKMMKRVKSLLVAASIVALVVGSAQIAGTMYLRNLGGATKTAQRIDGKPAQAPAAPKLAAVPTPSDKLIAPATIAAPMPSTPTTAQTGPDLLNPAALTATGDITGSIPDKPASHAPAVAPAQPAEPLPTAIGSARLRKAALAGDAGAAYEVAVRFAEGRGVTADPKQAAHWYQIAAAKGLALAEFRYASMLEKGIGVGKDIAQAQRLYRAAADQGNAKAMHNLAVIYAEGIDGKPDYAQAVIWFRKAAHHGVADSQYNLGILYARGFGVDKDLGKSYKWFALAAAHGDKEAAKKRDDIAGRLDSKELAATRQAVASFKAEPEPAIATAVPAPAGGWDRANAAPAKPYPRPGAPLSLGAFTVGKR
jgi:localization factor PodJL